VTKNLMVFSYYVPVATQCKILMTNIKRKSCKIKI